MERQRIRESRKPHSESFDPGRPRAPERAPVTPIHRLQETLGNRALGEFIQAKLNVSQPGDAHEQEADRVADQVMRLPDPAHSKSNRLIEQTATSTGLQRACSKCEEEGTTDPEKVKQNEQHLQAKSVRGGEAGPRSTEAVLNTLGRGGEPLSASTRAYFEPRFGHDFSRIRVHTDEQAAQSAQHINARAYTSGRDVVFGRSQYDPQSTIGRTLLAHELAHTIQQGQGVRTISQAVVAPQANRPTENEPGNGPGVTVANTISSSLKNGESLLARDGMDAGVSDAGVHDANTVSGGVPLPDAGSGTNAPGTTPTFLTTPTAPVSPNVHEYNTELGGLSVGNFDFHFRDCRILIWVWVRFQFESAIAAADQTAFKTRFFNAIHGVWGNSGYHLTGTAACPCRNVPIMVHAQESAAGAHYHKLVDVEREDRRESVISDMNLSLVTSNQTMAHEFGHVLGLYDEYDGGWLENRMFWHRNRPDDPNALMNSGSGLRTRYFEHYRGRAQETAGAGCDYTVSSPTPPVP